MWHIDIDRITWSDYLTEVVWHHFCFTEMDDKHLIDMLACIYLIPYSVAEASLWATNCFYVLLILPDKHCSSRRFHSIANTEVTNFIGDVCDGRWYFCCMSGWVRHYADPVGPNGRFQKQLYRWKWLNFMNFYIRDCVPSHSDYRS